MKVAHRIVQQRLKSYLLAKQKKCIFYSFTLLFDLHSFSRNRIETQIFDLLQQLLNSNLLLFLRILRIAKETEKVMS